MSYSRSVTCFLRMQRTGHAAQSIGAGSFRQAWRFVPSRRHRKQRLVGDPRGRQRLGLVSNSDHIRRRASIVSRRGAENSPAELNSSIAPLPARVGIKEAAVAPQSNAKSSERWPNAVLRLPATKGGCTSMNTRRSMAFSMQARRGRRELLQGHSLVQTPERFRMNGLQSHCHFKLPASRSRNRKQRSPNSAGWLSTMTLSKEFSQPRWPDSLQSVLRGDRKSFRCCRA